MQRDAGRAETLERQHSPHPERAAARFIPCFWKIVHAVAEIIISLARESAPPGPAQDGAYEYAPAPTGGPLCRRQPGALPCDRPPLSPIRIRPMTAPAKSKFLSEKPLGPQATPDEQRRGVARCPVKFRGNVRARQRRPARTDQTPESTPHTPLNANDFLNYWCGLWFLKWRALCPPRVRHRSPPHCASSWKNAALSGTVKRNSIFP